MRVPSLAVVLAVTAYAGGAAAQTCTTLPYNLQNGTTADATQVMADFNSILSCPHFSSNSYPTAIISGSSGTAISLQIINGNYSPGNYWNLANDSVGGFTLNHNGTDIFWIGRSGGQNAIFVGSVGIGTASPSAHLHVYNTAAGPVSFMVSGYGVSGNQWGSVWQSSTDANGSAPLMFENASGSGVGSIWTTASSTSFNTSSDRRVKENISAATRGLDVVVKIPVRNFNFINDPHKRRVEGFIAQELYKLYPEAVTTNGDDGVKPLAKGATPWSVDYGRLTPLLVKSIQELKAANEKLAAQVAALKAESRLKVQQAKEAELKAEIDELRGEIAAIKSAQK